MLDNRIFERSRRLIRIEFKKSNEEFFNELSKTKREFQNKGMTDSSGQRKRILKLAKDELEKRRQLAWDSIKQVHISLGQVLSENLASDLKLEMREHIKRTGEELRRVVRKECSGGPDSKWSIQWSDAQQDSLSKAEVDIDIYVDSLEQDRQVDAGKEPQAQKARSLPQPPASSITVDEASISLCSVSDQATTDDALGFAPYVSAVAEFLTSRDTKPPLTLSVEGEWGSGKSSFMLQLVEELKKKGAWVFQFSPWRHDSEDSLWAAFALEFMRDLSTKLGRWKRFFASCRLLKDRFNWKNGWFDVLKVIVLAAIWFLAICTGGFVLIQEWGWLPAQVPTNLAKLITLLVAIYFAALGFKRLKDMFGSPLDIDLKKYVTTPDYVSRISFIEQFHKDFKNMIEAYAKRRKVYVFIDDLDRCAVPKAADLMQAINLMITNEPQLIFVIGMDREKVAAALAAKHEKLLPYIIPDNDASSFSSALDYGRSFIEKFVQLPFVIPRPRRDDIRQLIQKIGEPAREESQAIQEESTQGRKEVPRISIPSERSEEQRREMVRLKLAGDSPEIRDIVLMVAPTLDYNPRRVKQFINLFRLRAYIANATGLFDIIGSANQFERLTLEQLGKFVAISMRWPSLIATLDREPYLLKRLARITFGEAVENESETVKEWAKVKELMSLIQYDPSPKDQKGIGQEWPKYSLLYPDVRMLLQVSPVVSRTRVFREKLQVTAEATVKARDNMKVQLAQPPEAKKSKETKKKTKKKKKKTKEKKSTKKVRKKKK